MTLGGMEYQWTQHAIDRFRERIGGSRLEALDRAKKAGKGVMRRIRENCPHHTVTRSYPVFYRVRYDSNGAHDVFVIKVEGKGMAKVLTCWKMEAA